MSRAESAQSDGLNISPVLHVSTVTMTQAALIGDQLILEEDYDENYTPSEQGTLL